MYRAYIMYQVKGKGRIVKKEWVEDSHHRRTRLSCHKYSLTPELDPPGQEEEEIFESEAASSNTTHR